MKNWKKIIISVLITLVVSFVLFYFMIPPINITSLYFWFYVLIVLVVFILNISFTSFDGIMKDAKYPKGINRLLGIIGGCFGSIIFIIVVIDIISSPIFNSKKYANRINIDESGDFLKDIEKVNFKHLPLLDKKSSQKLGDRVMGQMPELVSQFEVSDLYTQINYNDDIIRVTPLEYNGFIKYLGNKKDGVKGYITVDSVTGEAKLVKLEKGMKYMPSAYFSKDLKRTLRFKYPTVIFDEPSFEIDNEGNPYWVVPTIKYSGVGLRKEINGVVVLDPITGKSKKYGINDVPTWIDHVYSADLIIDQVNNWGVYKKGFLNSIFGQKEVVQTTDGYNYLIMNDDVYLYTGITSKSSDESNIGFILTNMRTKDTVFYAVPGAEEYSAMASAEGQVQQMNYTASFPLLINLNNKPTYLLSLKDNAGLVKMYAFVDVVDYQKVSVSDSSLGIEAAAQKYLGSDYNANSDELLSSHIVIRSITSANVDGNTNYYFRDTDGKKYKASIKVNEEVLPFLKAEDKLKIYYVSEEVLTNVIKLEKEY